MAHYLGVARDHGITDEEIGAIQALVMGVSAGKANAMFRQVEEGSLSHIKGSAKTMAELLPDGEEIRRAVKWVSEQIQESPEKPVSPFVQEAIFKFDLSPRDAEFLIGFFGGRRTGS